MEITQVKIRRLFEEERLCALVSVVLDDCIVVHDIKIINGPARRFVAMPSRRESDGRYRDIVHPINAAFRTKLEQTVLSAYEAYGNAGAGAE